MTKIAVVVYSSYSHIISLSKSEIEGIKAAGVEVDAFQIPSSEPLDASSKSGLPEISPEQLAKYDGVLFGVPTRFGNVPYALKAFIDATSSQWLTAGYAGKYVGVFVSTGTPNGGQETTVRNLLSTFVHHGMIYVPLGYKNTFAELTNLEEFHGGSPWGAGTYAGADGSRQVTELEHKIAKIQGEEFAKTVLNATKPKTATAGAAGTAGTAGTAGVAGAAGTSSATKTGPATTAPAAGTTATTGTAATGTTPAGAKSTPVANAKTETKPAADATTEKKEKEGRCFGCCIIS